MNARWPFRSLANVASAIGVPSGSTAQAASVALWVSTPIAVILPSANRFQVVGRTGSSALSEARSYQATSSPIDRDGGGTWAYGQSERPASLWGATRLLDRTIAARRWPVEGDALIVCGRQRPRGPLTD